VRSSSFVRPRLVAALAALVCLGMMASACGDDSSSAESSGTTASAPVTVRLGYFPNLTHAPALVGVGKGYFVKELGKNKLETKNFNSGTEAVTALFSDALDISYVGPNPAINAYAKSKGEAIRIISGAASGGAALVVKPNITSPEQLKGTTLATPQLGNTQDVALRYWLKSKGLTADTSGGGDVSIKPQDNGDTLTAFKQGQIAGAWVPEPWATRLVQEGGGKVLVNEASLWPDGQFVTTHIIVRTEFLEAHPDVVEDVLKGNLDALDEIAKDPTGAQKAVNDQIEAITQKPLAEGVITTAWKDLQFTADPIASSLETSAKHAEEVGLLEPVDLKGIYDLTLLNQLLDSSGKASVKGLT
jgi:NitT/TauT family transport system substrate-binding protein